MSTNSLEKVLVATDLSTAADEAIRQAAEWALAARATLVVCHVIPVSAHTDPFFALFNQQLALELPELRRRIEAELAARVTAVSGGEPESVDVLIEQGTPHAVIVEKAEALGANLLVIGPPATTGLDRLLATSVSEQVVRHAHCPVLVARPHARSGHILVATDLSDPALPAIKAAAAAMRRTGAQLTILFSVDVVWPLSLYEGFGHSPAMVTASSELMDTLRREADARLQHALDSVDVTGERLVVEGPPAHSIVRAAEERNADLIVMGTVGRTGLKRAVLGSVAEAVLRNAPCSVLVVRLHPQG